MPLYIYTLPDLNVLLLTRPPGPGRAQDRQQISVNLLHPRGGGGVRASPNYPQPLLCGCARMECGGNSPNL